MNRTLCVTNPQSSLIVLILDHYRYLFSVTN